MANYPTSLPNLSNPAASDARTGHAQQHASANDEIEAIAAKLGLPVSPSAGTVHYRLDALEDAPGGGVTDHGALTGLADDDHAQYHNNARGDARYSELGHEHDADYAPIANGVTNGDSHNHLGGDGGAIAYSSLSGTPTLGGAAALNVGTGAGTVAAGDDARLAAETAATIGALIAGATAKAVPVVADSLLVSDSAASGVGKKTTIAQLIDAIYKSGLKRVIFSDAKPWILCSDGTLNAGAAGAATITGITTLQRAYAAPGGWVHVPSVGSHIGGWLRFTSATTTVITLQDAIATGGAFSQTTGTNITGPSFTLPGGALGPNGGMKFTYQFSMTSSATVKSGRFSLGGSVLGPNASITTSGSHKGFFNTHNRGSEQMQASGLAGTPNVSGSSSVTALSITVTSADTSTDTTVDAALYVNASASDWFALEYLNVEIYYGA